MPDNKTPEPSDTGFNTTGDLISTHASVAMRFQLQTLKTATLSCSVRSLGAKPSG